MLSIVKLQKTILISIFVSLFTTLSVCQEIDPNKTVYGPVKPNYDEFRAYAIALSDDNKKVFTLGEGLSIFDVSTPSNMTVERAGVVNYDEMIEFKDSVITMIGEKAYNSLMNDSLKPYSRTHYGVQETYDSVISNDGAYEFLIARGGLYAVKNPNIVKNPKADNVKNDFNGDGIADILWRKGSTNHVWLMHANGSHTHKNIGNKKKGYYLASTGDFNGDGITDILWRYKSTGTNHIWYMHADGSHTYKSIGKKNIAYYVAGTGDFDGDGKTDILWRNGVKNHVWYMRANGTHKYKNIGGKKLECSAANIADFSGNGNDDILWVCDQYSHYVWVINPDGSHGGNYNYWYDRESTSKEHGNHVLSRQVGDFDNDGFADVFTSEEHNTTILYTQPGEDYYTGEIVGNVTQYKDKITSNAPEALGYKLVSADDFNGDGISDILWRDKSGNNIIWMMQENGDYFSVDIGSKSTSYAPSAWVVPSKVYATGEIRSLAVKDKDIANLDVSNVTNMNYAFHGLSTFNQSIGNWDVSNVEYMKYMFSEASKFNQPIGNWDVSRVRTMGHMFSEAGNFNQPIGDWNVSSVKYMYSMFFRSSSFNRPLADWDVSSAITMTYMFSAAENFNQPLLNWDVSSVRKMYRMFNNSSSFNQNISSWDVSSVYSYNAFSSNGVLISEYKPNFK